MYDVIVVGGGQAGLTAAYVLQHQKLNYVVLDANQQIGDSWRKRFSSLHLFTPNNLNKLAGFVAPHGRERYLSKDEFAEYLVEYQHHFELNVQLNSKVTAIRQSLEGFSVTLADQSQLEAKQVILATGAFQSPITADFSESINDSVQQFTVETIADTEFSEQRILVVGDGASGRQIAKQYAESGNQVTLACGKKRHLLPQRFLGFEIFSLLNRFGVLTLDKNHKMAKKIRDRDPFPDTDINDKKLRQLGICLKPKLTAWAEQGQFADGTNDDFDAVIWAMGYRNDYRWVAIPELFVNGDIQTENGITPVDGLYTLSVPWQTSRSSSLVCGVERDMHLLFSTLVKRHRGFMING